MIFRLIPRSRRIVERWTASSFGVMRRWLAFVAPAAMSSRDQGRGGGRNGRRHPHGLRGREIGLYYAARSRQENASGAPRATKEERAKARIARRLLDEYPQRLQISSETVASLKNAVNQLSGKQFPPKDFLDNERSEQRRSSPWAETTRQVAKQTSPPECKTSELLVHRMKLPVWCRRQEIVGAVRDSQVVVISGETGCGKTTQVPQFILDDLYPEDQIICTQPRRISAIGVAERVAVERGEPIGESVGYQIRLEAVKSKNTRLLFCTTGVLLRRLQSDPALNAVSLVIVDEVHERSMDADFLLIILRDLVRNRRDLHVVLMSATIDTSVFANYFGDCPTVHVPGFTYNVTDYFLEDIIERTGYIADDPRAGNTEFKGSRGGFGKKLSREVRKKARSRDIQGDIAELRQICGSSYSDATLCSVSTIMDYTDGSVPLDIIERVLEYIDAEMEDGAVLVFLPGWDDICRMRDTLMRHRRFGDRNYFCIVCLHSMMPTIDQKQVFDKPPQGMRKIVLSTNIAETSVTIDDVVFVIDSGRCKEKTYDASTNVACLLPAWVSRASAHQRRGRAGRVRNGYCFRLYSSLAHSNFKEYGEPELLRAPLESLCLQVKALKVGQISSFLGRALQAPDDKAVLNAVELLRTIGALQHEREELTALGSHLAKLPLDPRLGKMLLYAVIFKCLDPILTIASSLGFRNPFVLPFGKKAEADKSKASFAGGRLSDHAAFINAFNQWKRAGGGGGRDYYSDAFAARNFISSSAMRMIEEMRQQFLDILCDAGFINRRIRQRKLFTDAVLNANADNWPVVKGVLVAGLSPSICRVDFGRSRKSLFTRNDGRVKAHPSSTMSTRQNLISHRWAVYYEKLKSTSVFLLDITEVSPMALCLFGGTPSVCEVSRRIAIETGDGNLGSAAHLPSHLLRRPWVTFEDTNGIGVHVVQFRQYLDSLVRILIQNPLRGGECARDGCMKLILDTVSLLLMDSERYPYHDQVRFPLARAKSGPRDADDENDESDEENGDSRFQP